MNKMYCVVGAAWSAIRDVSGDNAGTTAIEYALIAAGISVVIVTVVNNLGTEVNAMFVEVKNSF